MDWHETNFLTCFQGLINRQEPRIYFIHSKADQFWLDYYQQKFGIPYDILSDANELIKKFSDEINGYIIYDTAMVHSLNLAMLIGSLKNGLPTTKELEKKFQKFQLKKIDDLSGRWENYLQAYEWALTELQPKSNQGLLAQLCIHYPHWPASTFANRDYVYAHKIFALDLSASERDKADYQILNRVYQAYPPGAIVIGWHCVRDHEHEAIALQSKFGHLGLCTLHTPNLTVHSSLRLEPGKIFKQRTIKKKDLKVEDKVYLAFQTTDGDATWFVLNLINTDWTNPAHGRCKYNWGFLPLAYALMPGMVHYYFEHLKENDFFVAGPSGATYTYPHLHPQPRKFFQLTKYYMEKCGLNVVHITNWNDREWWQEAEVKGYHQQLKKYLPGCVGYLRGMGESAFEKHYLQGGKPYVFCGEGIHKGNDVYQTIRDFVDACPNRPLFIYCLVNHSIPMSEIKAAIDKFATEPLELVHLDELLLLIEKAFQQGKISEELYPDKNGLTRLLVHEAKQAWPAFYGELEDFQAQFQNGEQTYLENIRKTTIGLENIKPGDFLAFATIWHSMKLVKLALEARGIYVNNKPKATRDFLREFSYLTDVKIIKELQGLWDSWHQRAISFPEAEQLANRLMRLASEINKESNETKRA